MSDCCVCGNYTTIGIEKWYPDMRHIFMPMCVVCAGTLPHNSLDKILDSKYNATYPNKEDKMCKCKKDVDGFTFICKHSDGTEIVFTVPLDSTWRELGIQFRNFVMASGYIINRSDCLCDAEFDGPLIDDIHCPGCKCKDDEHQYDGVPT